ncbi:hypothetical protein [Spiroplasma culicicola]|uniref:Transmembrane protein n=1 Tax=Spiroplasma culicicola AES-1 TaxID=1276246 RepID=W6A6Y5_9MOLU|nr:hypothetical protein [Spiroplasma culicicola]AHI52640.1 hypothetical protein SCULI_v1c02990 [Spiroplasma culicicola AES-1]
MGFKLGALVSYNNENWVIVDMITKQITEGNLYFLKIKNILTQEIISVDSRMVQEVSVKKKEPIKEQSIDDTAYIQSLFDEVGNMDTDEFFDLDSQETFDLSELNITDDNDIQSDNPQLTRLVENFQIPETKVHLTPRRAVTPSSFESVPPVDETLSNMNPIGELNTREFIPSRLTRPMVEETKTIVKEAREMVNEINIQPSRLKQENPVYQQQEAEPIQEKRMASTELFHNIQPVEEPKFEENLNSFVSLETEKRVVEGLSDKADKFKEQHFDALTTGPLNTKKLFDSFNKQQKIQQNLDDNFKKNSDTKTDVTLFGVQSNFDKNALKESKIYHKFKVMSGWLIAMFIILLIIPFAYGFMKLSYSWLQTGGTIDFKQLIIINLTLESGMVYFIADLLLVVAFPIWLAIFTMYLVIYLINVNDKQYKKIAFYNFQLENKISVIDSIQEYNNESSLYLIKVHNDMKKLKKDVKSLKNNANINDSLNEEQRINIPH